jgi:hypothetical protein
VFVRSVQNPARASDNGTHATDAHAPFARRRPQHRPRGGGGEGSLWDSEGRAGVFTLHNNYGDSTSVIYEELYVVAGAMLVHRYTLVVQQLQPATLPHTIPTPPWQAPPSLCPVTTHIRLSLPPVHPQPPPPPFCLPRSPQNYHSIASGNSRRPKRTARPPRTPRTPPKPHKNSTTSRDPPPSPPPLGRCCGSLRANGACASVAWVPLSDARAGFGTNLTNTPPPAPSPHLPPSDPVQPTLRALSCLPEPRSRRGTNWYTRLGHEG